MSEPMSAERLADISDVIDMGWPLPNRSARDLLAEARRLQASEAGATAAVDRLEREAMELRRTIAGMVKR